jgi:hypothetical protein
LAAQAKPLIKVAPGYGSADGAVTPLWFAKETKLFEKYGLVLDKHRVGPSQWIASATKDRKIPVAQALSSAFLKGETHALGKKRCPAPTVSFCPVPRWAAHIPLWETYVNDSGTESHALTPEHHPLGGKA